jgi:glucose-6-phosphate isomerase
LKAQFWADFSLVDFPESYLDSMNQPITEALQKMEELENGSIANPDENRMVGHYWLRTPTLAPSQELTDTIQKTLVQLKQISKKVHSMAHFNLPQVRLLIFWLSALEVQHLVHNL